MIRKIVRAVALVALSSAAVAEAQTTTAIIGARVIDGTGAPARLETVILQGQPDPCRLSQGRDSPGAPAYWTQPGRLFDLHTHLNASGTDAVDDLGKSLKAYLVCGVTSVNDYGHRQPAVDWQRRCRAKPHRSRSDQLRADIRPFC